MSVGISSMEKRIVALLAMVLMLCVTNSRGKVEKTLCVLGGRPGFIYGENAINSTSNTAETILPPSLPPILYVKTHKTGSGTMANILCRMADVRQLRVMTNQLGQSKLGWPEQFPGDARKHNSMHSIDMISAHCVYNKKLMDAYMKPLPFRVTTIREPFSQQVSVYNFFYLLHGVTWDDYIHNATITNEHSDLLHRARMRNSQSFDLGWYEHLDGSFAYDNDRERINAFITSLERDFDLVICMEDMDRGLVLLSYMLGVSVNEMVNVAVAHHGAHDQYVYPSPEEYKSIVEKLNPVDVALYNHFCPQKFESKWVAASEEVRKAGGQSLDDRLSSLQKMNQEVNDACACSNGNLKACHLSLLMSSDPYHDVFIRREKHLDKNYLTAEDCHHLQKDVRHQGESILRSLYPLCTSS